MEDVIEIYISWNNNIDNSFRESYKDVVQEKIGTPLKMGDKYLVCSHRITDNQIETLKGDYPDVTFTDTYPDDFIAELADGTS